MPITAKLTYFGKAKDSTEGHQKTENIGIEEHRVAITAMKKDTTVLNVQKKKDI